MMQNEISADISQFLIFTESSCASSVLTGNVGTEEEEEETDRR